MAYIGVSPSNGVRRKHTYTATASQTSFSGAGAEGATLSYNDSNFVDVYQNGVKLSEADYTSTSGTAIVLATGATVSDMIEIIVYDVFSVADTVSKADGGTFDGNVTMAGTLGVTGAVTANAGVSIDNITIDGSEIDLSSGDLTIDVAGDIILDADGGDFIFKDGGSGDEANKVIRFSTPSHDTDEENVQILQVESEGAFNQISFGGGTSALNASTKLRFLTAGVDTTTGVERISIDSSGNIVFNDTSVDSDFRVESNGNANMLFVDGGNNTVHIGQSAPDTTISGGTPPFQITGSGFSATSAIVRREASSFGPSLMLAKSRNTAVGSHTIVQSGDRLGGIIFIGDDGTDLDTYGASITADCDGTPGANDMPGRLVFSTTADGANSPTERLRINAEGNILSGLTSRLFYDHTGTVNLSAAGDSALKLNRSSSQGNNILLGFDGTSRGAIGIGSGNVLYVGGGDVFLSFFATGDSVYPANNDGGGRDNAIDLGTSSARFQTLYATTSSINTSDKNEKQDIEELTDAEKRVAVVAKSLLRKYRWKDAVDKKGDKARIHFGIMSQDLQDAFTAESLDASRYGMFCSNTWWEKEITVDAVEAKDAVYEEVTDSDGMKTSNLISGAVEAKDAYTYIDTKQEATEGYTEKTRLGVRYSELLAFIISAI